MQPPPAVGGRGCPAVPGKGVDIVGPIKAISSGYRNVLNFKGRALRSEFWWFLLFLVLLSSVIETVIAPDLFTPSNGGEAGFGLRFSLSFGLGPNIHWATNLFTLATLPPLISVTVRRLHDIGRSGFLILAPVVAVAAALWIAVNLSGLFGQIVAVSTAIWWIILTTTPGSLVANRFGPSPAANEKPVSNPNEVPS